MDHSRNAREEMEFLASRYVDGTLEERERLVKELGDAQSYIEGLEKRLANEQFLAKAPAKVIQDMRGKLSEAETRAAGLRDRIETL